MPNGMCEGFRALAFFLACRRPKSAKCQSLEQNSRAKDCALGPFPGTFLGEEPKKVHGPQQYKERTFDCFFAEDCGLKTADFFPS